jgi:hypothetical protein
MERKKQLDNENFFISVLDYLQEGGHYIFPAKNKYFIKNYNKLTGDKDALEVVKNLVSERFYNEHFKLKKTDE